MNVTTLIFLGLAVVWAIVLLPEAIRKFSGTRNGDSIRSFNHQLSMLDRSSGTRDAVPSGTSNVINLPRSRSAAPIEHTREVSPAVRRRRQEVLMVLGSGAVISLLAAIAFGGAMLVIHLLIDVLLVAYLVALFQVSRQPVVRRVEPHSSHVAVTPARMADPMSRRIAN